MTQSLSPLRPAAWIRRTLAPAASVALLALVLAGCTGSPAPATSSASTSTPPATATPSYKPADAKGKAENVPLPVMPDAAKAHTMEGLQSFMKHWVALLSYAYETGDTGPLFEVTGGGCTSCKNMQHVVSDAFADGKWIQGGQMTYVSSDSNMEPNQYGQISGIVRMKQGPTVFMNADGSVRAASGDDAEDPNLFLVVPRDGGWELGDIGAPGDGK